MGFIKKFGIASIALVVCLSVCLYTPLPEGIDEPFKLQMALVTFSGMELMVKVKSALGFGDVVNNTRTLITDFVGAEVKERVEPLLEITDTEFDGVPVRLYRPKSLPPSSPVLVYYHGGGWTYGNRDFVDKMIVMIAKETGMFVVSVDYRLSPEHPFPVPFADCVTATLHLIANHKKYGVDPSKVAVGGDSSGGNLAAAVALKLSNDPKLPNLSLQVLIYPVMQAFNFKVPSYTTSKNFAILPPFEMAWFWSNYVGPTSHPNLPQAFLDNQHTSPEIKKSHYAKLVDPELALPKEHLGKVEAFDINSGNVTLWKEIGDKVLNPYVCPLLAPQVDKLPPTVFISADHDILRDEGLMYVERLKKAGVRVKLRRYNALHGFTIFADEFKVSLQSVEDIITDLKEHFKL